MKDSIYLLIALFFSGLVSSQTISCPINHDDLNAGYFDLQYEFGLPFNPELPTVVVVSDAQQFYVRSGRINKIQNELFGENFNVLGLIPRSGNEDLLQKVNIINKKKTDWKLAYTIFNSKQFVNDLELIINQVLSNQQSIYLYGQSGGAFLITEYLSQFPNSKVKKVFIGASVNPIIEDKLGILHDNFQRSYLSKKREEKEKLKAVLSENFFSRKLVVSLFQRQNFFVELAELHKERSTLIKHLYIKDTIYINSLKRNYQIDAINKLFESSRGISIRVRLAEFIYPLLGDWKRDEDIFYPDLENSYNIALPVLELKKEDSNFHITQGFDENEFRKYEGDLFILSGRYDHVADYRSSIYLNGLSENSFLFIANDDHTFKALKANDSYKQLIQDFFLSSDNHWISNYGKYLWREY